MSGSGGAKCGGITHETSGESGVSPYFAVNFDHATTNNELDFGGCEGIL
jgi:hypothetical protein